MASASTQALEASSGGKAVHLGALERSSGGKVVHPRALEASSVAGTVPGRPEVSAVFAAGHLQAREMFGAGQTALHLQDLEAAH